MWHATSDMGYKAIRVQSGIPGLDATYGVPKGTTPYEPAERGLPSESRWSTEKYLNHVPKLFARVASNNSATTCICCTTATTGSPPSKPRASAKNSSPFTSSGWKIPVPPNCRRASALIREHTTTPIATGEVFNSIWDAHELIRNQWIDYIAPDAHPRRRLHARSER